MMASSQSPYAPMTTSRDAPNPLRPYYVPPSIGATPGQPANIPTASTSGPKAGIGRSARDLLSELDYGGPLLDRDGPTVAEMGKKIVDQAIWKYTSVLLAQPFDIAKVILQVRLAAASEAEAEKKVQSRKSSASRDVDRRYSEYPVSSETESEDDQPSYFTPTKPQRSRSRYGDESPSRRRTRRRQTPPSRSDSATPIPQSYNHKLALRRPDSIMEVLSQLWQQSGATGLWRATNATFIYNVLSKAIESWTRSLLSALVNLPDPSALAGGPSEIVASVMGGLDVGDSPAPMMSLAIAVASAGIAGILLAPLDLVRTRLILTPATQAPRAIFQCLRLLPSFTSPTSLLPVTILHSALPTLITSSTPLFLRQYLSIDPIITPASYSISTFFTSAAELFLKLPLETVLRRGQVAVLRQQHQRQYQQAAHQHFRGDAKVGEPDLNTIVDVGPYRGVFGTMWHIAREEGIRETPTVTTTPLRVRREPKKGQGIGGLWRGWRVGMWGLCGVWAASALGGGSGAGSEF